ncbi:MAG: YfhH family protein [Caldibacillus sp.]
MEKSFSQMTEHELKQEITRLREKARKAEQAGMLNEYEVYERKAIVAESYLLNPFDFKTSKVYRFKTDPETYFRIDYFKGVFAWGYRLNGDGSKEGVPLALLEEVKEPVPYY